MLNTVCIPQLQVNQIQMHYSLTFSHWSRIKSRDVLLVQLGEQMPIHNIETEEYECGHCGHKWINRRNGKNGPIPKKCANCKRSNWNDPSQRIGPIEIGLRRKIKEFDKVYRYGISVGVIRNRSFFPSDLSRKFLEIKPRPTLKELYKVVYPFGYDIELKSWVRNPDRPGKLMRNPNMENLQRQQMEGRQEYMIQIMKSRGLEYDPTVGLLAAEELYRKEIWNPVHLQHSNSDSGEIVEQSSI